MSLVNALQELLTTRAGLVAAIAEIDAELAEAKRLVLGVPTQSVIASGALVAPAVNQANACERCGKPFERTAGSSGRFCSRTCYVPLDVEARRGLILAALAREPKFPSQIAQADGLRGVVSRGTITNDLYALLKQKRIVNGEDGWRLRTATDTEDPVESDAPFPTPPPSVESQNSLRSNPS